MEITKFEENYFDENGKKGEQARLTKRLAEASEAYYNGQDSGMSDLEFDRLCQELKGLESENGFIFDISPTVAVGGPATVEDLEKAQHEMPALSLDKVKYEQRASLVGWLDGKEGVLSWKMDGLTIVATYEHGRLKSAVTRGNGREGSVVTHNARYFKGLPVKIPYDGKLIVRGEAVMSHLEFKRVNEEAGGAYENARNLAASTVQMLDSNESRKREIVFKAFELAVPGVGESLRTETGRFKFLKEMGFQVVDHIKTTGGTILDDIEDLQEKRDHCIFPTDGIVLTYEDQGYAESLGDTGHHPRGSIALKWTDETVGTTVRSMEWSVGKTGLITPVAVFDTVRLGIGSNVNKASLHNLSIMEMKKVKIGCKAQVYLANMIIPQIAGTDGSGEEVAIPKACPICGHPTKVEDRNGIRTLHCDNKGCTGRHIGNLMNTFSREGLFVKGLGESQMNDLVQRGLVKDTLDVYTLRRRAEEDPDTARSVSGLLDGRGWGKKSWNKLLDAIDASRKTTLPKFLYSLNIPLLGRDLSKKLSKFWDQDIMEFVGFIERSDEGPGKNDRCGYERAMGMLMAIDGVGNEKAENVASWAADIASDPAKLADLRSLISELDFPGPRKRKIDGGVPDTGDNGTLGNEETHAGNSPLDNGLNGLTFVITGTVNIYKNRDEFKESVEARGGKVAGSVSKKTSYLVTNDKGSGSSKNKKAAELNIPVISEREFIEKFGK